MRTVLSCDGANSSSRRVSVLKRRSITRLDRSDRSKRSDRAKRSDRSDRSDRSRSDRSQNDSNDPNDTNDPNGSYGELREKSLGAAAVRFDLRAQRVDILELPFVPEPLHEAESQRPPVQIR